MRAAIFCLIALGSGAAAQSFSSQGPQGTLGPLDEAPVQRPIAMTCQFDLECYEGEACQETTFEFELKGLAGGLTPDALAAVVDMESDLGNEKLLGTVAGDVTLLSGGAVQARHMLSMSGQAARYTLHFSDGPVVISYLGACEASE